MPFKDSEIGKGEKTQSGGKRAITGPRDTGTTVSKGILASCITGKMSGPSHPPVPQLGTSPVG